ncbi:hypothetical protein [Vibrio aerogenes]|nr:hypothetical protein [Vibrio aerogenes]
MSSWLGESNLLVNHPHSVAGRAEKVYEFHAGLWFLVGMHTGQNHASGG